MVAWLIKSPRRKKLVECPPSQEQRSDKPAAPVNSPEAVTVALREIPAENKREDKAKGKHHRRDRARYVVEFLTLVAVVAYGFVAYLQWRAMTDATRTTREALVASSRAWISPDNVYITSKMEINIPFQFAVQYRNTGRSPALDSHPTYTLSKLPVTYFENNTFNSYIESTEPCKELEPAPGADVIYAGMPDSNPYKLLFAVNEAHKDWIDDDVVSGRKAIILRMCFAYRTMNEVHHTSFCYFYRKGVSQPDLRMNICTAGNHAD